MSKSSAMSGAAAGMSGLANVAAYELYLSQHKVQAAAVAGAQLVLALAVSNKDVKMAALAGAVVQGGLAIVDFLAGA